MDVDNLVLTAWSYGLAALAYAFMGLALWRRGYAKRPLERAKATMLLSALASVAWGASLVFLTTSGLAWSLHAAQLADAVRYGAWFVFLLALLHVRRDTRDPGISWLAPVSAVAVLVVLGLELAAMSRFVDPQHLRKPMLYGNLSLPVVGMVLLEQLFRNVTVDSRWNIKPLCLGLAGMFMFDLYLYSQAALFGAVDSDAFTTRGAVHGLVVPLLLLSTSRHKDWMDKIQISRKAAFHSATLMIAGAYLVFVSGVGYYVRYFGGEWGRALQVALVFAGLVMLMVLAASASMRARLRVFLSKHFFRYRYDYREEWLRFTQTLSAAQNSPQEMGSQVVRGLADMLDSPGGGLWLRTRGEKTYRQSARWNMAASAIPEPQDSALCEFLRGSGWVVNLEEFRSFPRRYGRLVLPEWLQELPQAWLVVPLVVGEEMIGFVILASARAPMDVNWEVNDLLKTAGRQAASFLAQMQATEALLEVRKFDAFNRMSAFVVHDLKNVVTQLSLMMKNARRLQDNPEFREDMLMTVDNALDRMRQLMLQLREGATPSGTAFGVQLEAIAQRLAESAAERGRTVVLDIVTPVVTRGHEDRLERVIGHMVQNALDATGPDDRVWLKLDRLSGQALIEVGDTGHGMSEEFIRERLFKPFQTTKQAGMGIGAYESFQYVQELGGKITVDSQVDEGTIITVLLPLFESQRQSDLQPLEAP